MRHEGRKWIEKTVKGQEIQGPIIEMGAFRVPGQETLADLRPLFPGKQYIGCDQQPGPGVDRIENIEDINIADNTAGTILCIDTLEHVKNTFKACKEMFRILKYGGLIIISSVFLFPIHNWPNDYWRFTPAAFELLLEDFKDVQTEWDGQEKFPIGIYAHGRKPPAGPKI